MSSFYSGFVTKQQEVFYNKLIFKLCVIMQGELVKKFKDKIEKSDMPFITKMLKL